MAFPSGMPLFKQKGKTMESSAIATVVAVIGEAFARNSDGEMR